MRYPQNGMALRIFLFSVLAVRYLWNVVGRLLEVSVEESLETCTVTGFVLAHLMNSIVDGI